MGGNNVTLADRCRCELHHGTAWSRALNWFDNPQEGHTHMKNHPATKPAPTELSAAELKNVAGGKGAGKADFHDFNFTHTVDKASPVLLMSLGV